MNNKTKQVLCEMQVLDEEIFLTNTENKDDSVLDEKVEAYYVIFEDETMASAYAFATPVRPGDFNLEERTWTNSGYQVNNEGNSVLTISNTIDECTDIGYYIGIYEYNGQIYDQWQVIESEGSNGDFNWDNKKYILTDRIN